MKSDLDRLEMAHEVAWAQLGVAEDFGWFSAITCGLLAYMFFGWIAGIVVFPLVFYFSTKPYRDAEVKATDAYHRAAKTGQYAEWLRTPAKDE
jgi:hypothetical protein